jgi:TolB protein
MTSEGTRVRRLTNHRGLDTRPAWSADGRQLAFTSLRDGNYDIYVMNVDGSRVRRVTRHEERDDFAFWHPKGQQLVVVSERRGQHDLYLVDVPD